jgi:hypothetical protein
MDEFNVTRAPEGGAELSMAKLYPAGLAGGPGD